MKARTVKRLIAGAMALGLSIPLTPAVLSLLSRAFPNAVGRQVAIVPNRGWELRDRHEGPSVAAGVDCNGDVREGREFAEPFELFTSHSSRSVAEWLESWDDDVLQGGHDLYSRFARFSAAPHLQFGRSTLGVALIDSGSVPPVEFVDSIGPLHLSGSVAFGHGTHVDGITKAAAAAVVPVDAGWFAIDLQGRTDVGPRLLEVAFTPDAGPTTTYHLAAAVSPESATSAWLHVPTRGVVQVRDLSVCTDTQWAGSITRARWLDMAFALAIVCGWGIGTLVWLVMTPMLYVASLSLVERLPLRIRPMVTADVSLILRWAHLGLASMYGLWTMASVWMIGQRLLAVAAC